MPLLTTGAGLHRPVSGGGGGPVVPARVANNSGIKQNGGATASTTVFIDLPAAVVSGVTPVIWVGSPATSVSSVADNTLANTYTPGPTIRDTNNGYTWSGFYCLNITNGPTRITATVSSSTQFSTIVVDGFSGVLASGAFDGGAANVQLTIPPAANTITSTAITPTANGDLIIGATVSLGGSGSLAAGTGFTAGVNSSPDFFSEYLVQTTAGSVAATFTNSTTEGFITGVMAFKHA